MPRALVPLTAQAVADLVGGRLTGDGARVLTGVGPLDTADGDTLSFLASTRYLPEFRASGAGAVLVRPEAMADSTGPSTRIEVGDPHQALIRAIGAMFPDRPGPPGVDPSVRLGAGVALGAEVQIGPYAVLGAGVLLGDRVRVGPGTVLEDGVTVGADSEIGPRVVCYRGTRIGRRVTLKAGAVLGGTGFGYISGRDGHRRIPHVGGCVIEDDVDVGSNSCVDRGSVDDTVIGRGTKLDNHVHIGHNARLGSRCLVMGGTMVAGSAEIGNDVILAGRSSVAGHLKVGDRTRLAAMSGIAGTVAEDSVLSGFPARPHRQYLRAQAALYRLSRIVDEVEDVVDARSNGPGRG